MTLREYAELWLRQRRGQISQRAWEIERLQLWANILPHLGDRPLRELSASEIARWRDTLAAGNGDGRRRGGPQTARRALGLLKTMLSRAAGEYELVDRNPAAGVSLPKVRMRRPDSMTWEEFCRALEASGEHRLAVAVAGTLGLRWSEQFSLTERDVRRSNGVLYLEVARRAKTLASYRLVPVWDWLAPHVERLADLVRDLADRRLWPYSYQAWRRVWLGVCRRAGIERDWHELRHHAASLMIHMGLDVVHVSAVLGHSDPSVTLRVYAHAIRDYRLGYRRDPVEVAATVTKILDTAPQEPLA